MTTQPSSTQSAIAAHDAAVAAYQAQRERLWPSADMWAGAASNFKADPQAPLNDVQKYVASHLREDDTLLDVGGGAGRVSLPLASRCREVLVVDPSPGMEKTFEASVRDLDIANAHFVLSGWLEAESVAGDIALVSHVTYFVPQIEPFLQKLNASTRRRVIIATRSVPPPNQFAPFFKLAKGEDQALVPIPENVLAALRELGLDAELLDLGEAAMPATMPVAKTPEDAIRMQAEGGVRLGWLRPDETDRFTDSLKRKFEDLFAQTEEGYRPRTAVGAREIVITWETKR